MKTNTIVTVVITILVMLVIGLGMYIKLELPKEKETSQSQKETTTNNTVEENKEETKTTTENEIPNEETIRKLMGAYITKQPTIVEYRINSISLENNTQEFKELINENLDHVLAYVKYDVIRDGKLSKFSGRIADTRPLPASSSNFLYRDSNT